MYTVLVLSVPKNFLIALRSPRMMHAEPIFWLIPLPSVYARVSRAVF